MERKELLMKLQEVAEKSCAALRKGFPDSTFAWRWEGDRMLVSWDGDDLHEVRLTDLGDDSFSCEFVNLMAEKDEAQARKN